MSFNQSFLAGLNFLILQQTVLSAHIREFSSFVIQCYDAERTYYVQFQSQSNRTLCSGCKLLPFSRKSWFSLSTSHWKTILRAAISLRGLLQLLEKKNHLFRFPHHIRNQDSLEVHLRRTHLICTIRYEWYRSSRGREKEGKPGGQAISDKLTFSRS